MKFKTEAEWQEKLLEELTAQPGAVVFKHSDGLTSGIPDVSVTWNGFTSWWELKRAQDGRISGKELQRIRMIQLSMASAQCAWYVIWQAVGVSIVHPSEVNFEGRISMRSRQRAHGAVENFRFIVQFVYELHHVLLPSRK